MKYVSIDLETTGLDPDTCDIVEFGAVIEDTNNQLPLSELPTFHTYILPPKWGFYRGEPYALSMHPTIFRRIATKEEGYRYEEPSSLGGSFTVWLMQQGVIGFSGERVSVAGKNFDSFDRNFLNKLPNFSQLVSLHHRSIDPAILYWHPHEDDKLPGLELCLKRAGIDKPVTHNAVEDALLVVELVRKGDIYFFDRLHKPEYRGRGCSHTSVKS